MDARSLIVCVKGSQTHDWFEVKLGYNAKTCSYRVNAILKARNAPFLCQVQPKAVVQCVAFRPKKKKPYEQGQMRGIRKLPITSGTTSGGWAKLRDLCAFQVNDVVPEEATHKASTPRFMLSCVMPILGKGEAFRNRWSMLVKLIYGFVFRETVCRERHV